MNPLLEVLFELLLPEKERPENVKWCKPDYFFEILLLGDCLLFFHFVSLSKTSSIFLAPYQSCYCWPGKCKKVSSLCSEKWYN